MKRMIAGFLTATLIMSSMAMVGCSSKPKEQVLRFATWDTEAVLETQKKIAKRFEETHPGVKIQVEAYGEGYEQKIAAGFGAKNAPDVMYMWDFPTYQASLEPLNTYMDADADFKTLKEDLYPGILNYSTIDNNVLGLPVGYTSHVIYYNKTLFKNAGVAEPTGEWTWDEFRATAQKLSNKEKDIYGFALSTQPDPYDFEQFFWNDGTAYLSPDGKTADGYLNSPAAVKRMQFFADMIKEGSALGAQDSVSKAFRGGNIAMQESGIWPLSAHKEAIGAENLGIVGLPRSEKGKDATSVINSSALSMAKDSKQKELAWEFIKFYTSPEAVKMRAEIDLPVLKTVAEELGYTKDPYYAPFYSMLETAEGHTPAFLLNDNYTKIAEKITLAIEKVFVDTINGQPVDVKAALDQAVADSAEFFK